MKDETYELMRELVKAKDIQNYLSENYYPYFWMSDIRDIVTERIMELEDTIIADIKNA